MWTCPVLILKVLKCDIDDRLKSNQTNHSMIIHHITDRHESCSVVGGLTQPVRSEWFGRILWLKPIIFLICKIHGDAHSHVVWHEVKQCKSIEIYNILVQTCILRQMDKGLSKRCNTLYIYIYMGKIRHFPVSVII